MKKKLSSKIASVSIPVALSVPIAMAQTVGETTVYGDRVVGDTVSAYKTGTPLVDIPQSISVFSEAQIEEQGIDSIADIIDYTPGLNNSQGEGHRDSVVFRGVRSTSNFFVDGVRDDIQYYRPLYNVEQVEVLRGSNALLFGRGGVGGVLNRVSKKAQFGEKFSTQKLHVDTFGAFGGSFDANLSLNDNTAFRLNSYFENRENHRDFYYGEEFGINPTLSYKLNEDTRLDLSFEHLNHERYIDRGIPTGANGEPVERFRDITFGFEDENFSTFEANVFKATLSTKLANGWKASGTASYGDYDKTYANIYASDYEPALGGLAEDLVQLDGYRDTTQRQRFFIGGDLVGEFTTGSLDHKFVLGAEFINTKHENDRNHTNWDGAGEDQAWFNINALPTSFNNGIAVAHPDASHASGHPVGAVTGFYNQFGDDSELEQNIISIYASDEVKVNDKLDVVLGVRFDHIDQESTSFNSTGGVSSTADRADSRFSPRVGLVYDITERASLYASYSETFIPSNGDQYATVSDEDPDIFTNLEVGASFKVRDNLNVRLAAFQQDATITSFNSTLGALVESDAEVKGIEAQLLGKVTNNWNISVGYSYLDGETTSGVRPKELPEHTFSLWNSFKATDKINLGLGVIYQSEALTGNGSSSKLPSFVRVDASAKYKVSDSLSVQLHIENLFDTDYYPSSHSTHQATVGAPISARLGIRTEF